MKKYIKLSLPYILSEIVFDFLATLCIACVPYFQKLLFDQGINSITNIIILTILFLVVKICAVVFTNLCMKCTWKGAILFEQNLKLDFLNSIFRMDSKEFAKNDIGSYLSLQSNDITALEQDYLQPIIDIIRSVNMFVIYGVILFKFVDYRIGLTIFITSLLTVIGPKLTGQYLSKQRNNYQKQLEEYTVKIKDLLEGFSLINSRTRENICSVHKSILKLTSDKRYKYGKAKTFSLSVNSLTLDIVQVCSFFVTGILLIRGNITLGTAVASFGYVGSFLDPISSILYDVSAIQSVKEIKSKILSFIGSNKHSEKYSVVPSRSDFYKNILCQDVCLQREQFSIKEFNFTFTAGKKYAIIGPSGSGKSTLIHMLLGHIPIDSGDILFDGNSIEDIDLSSIAFCVHQNDHIFMAGYEDNISVFGSYPSKNFDYLLNNKLKNSILSKKSDDNCQVLSGGEQQILSFLRMLSANTPIVMLDEPFSAVDKTTAEKLEDYILTTDEFKNKTILCITHDLTEHLTKFDEILIMKEGQLLGSYSYSEIVDVVEFKELIQKNNDDFIQIPSTNMC